MMKKVILLLMTVLLCIVVLFPNKNKSVEIKEINYASVFNDLNPVQLNAAKSLGIDQPLKNRAALNDMKGGLVKIDDNRHYKVASLSYSVPYLTKGAAELLDMIGKNFLDSLESKGLNPNKIIVTSVLRTQEDVKKLRKSGNKNATQNSAHCYATTFDITYARYDKVYFNNFRWCQSVDEKTLKKVLGEVLRDLKGQKKCYVKHEVSQRCFHITTRI